MQEKPTTLVAGGAGFLGASLCERLLGWGRRVICWDNLYTGSSHNVERLATWDHFSFVEHDVTTYRPLPEGVSAVYNLACPASPPHYGRDPIQTLKTCVLGTLNLLEAAQARGARFLQASTSEIYGDPQVHPQPETYWGNVNPMGPRACYDEGKRAAETLCYDFRHARGLDVRVARIFNTYGPGMAADDGRVVSNFIVQALRGELLTVYGEGTQTRSFCFVDDLILGLVALMDHTVPPRTAVNVGNPTECTMLALAHIICRQTASGGGIRRLALPQDDPTRRRPDIAVAKRLFGWQPQVPLEEGIARTIAYFRQTHGPTGLLMP